MKKIVACRTMLLSLNIFGCVLGYECGLFIFICVYINFYTKTSKIIFSSYRVPLGAAKSEASQVPLTIVGTIKEGR